MGRVACVLVPFFAAVAAERAEPGLRERAFAVVSGAPPVTRVVEASAAAREQGVAPGMAEAAARARCPALATRPLVPELEESAAQALLQACLAVSPRLEDAGPGVVHVETGGLERLIGPDAAVGHRLARLVARVGLAARVAVADSRIAARVMARLASARVTVVPPGGDRAALAAVPLDAVNLSAELGATLARWGISTLGELAALPRAGVAARLGPAGLRAHDLARGCDGEPFRAWTPPAFWEEALGLDWEIDTLPALAAALERVLARLTARLDAAHLAADALTIELGLASGGRHDQAVALAYPLHEPGPMLALLRLALEAHPPPAPITRIALRASAVAARAVPRTLWEPTGPAPRDLDAALARLVALAGPRNVGSPVVGDSHRPDAFALIPFVPPPGAMEARGGGGGEAATSPGGAGNAGSAGNASGAGNAGSAGGASGAGNTGSAGGAPLALRRLRPPRPVAVETDDTARGEGRRPACVALDADPPRPVVACAGPWRVSGEWWDAQPWARDEWDVELAGGLVCRLARDRIAGRWYLDGVYD